MTSLVKICEPKDAPKKVARFFKETTVEAELSGYEPGFVIISADHVESDFHIWKLDLDLAALNWLGNKQSEDDCGPYILRQEAPRPRSH